MLILTKKLKQKCPSKIKYGTKNKYSNSANDIKHDIMILLLFFSH